MYQGKTGEGKEGDAGLTELRAGNISGLNISGLANTSDTSGLNISGLTNTSGLAGLSNASGLTNTSGLAGLSNTSGLAGLSNTSGLAGLSNASGLTNTSGLAGLSNASGLAGLTNTSGLAGLSNASGLAGLSSLQNTPALPTPMNTSGLSSLDHTLGLAALSNLSGLTSLSNTISNTSELSRFAAVTGLSTLTSTTGLSAFSNPSFAKPSGLASLSQEPSSNLSIQLTLPSAASPSYIQSRLIAKPTSFALSLCTPYKPPRIDLTLDELNEYYEDCNEDYDDYDEFDFDAPSPDDIILNAQKKSKVVNNKVPKKSAQAPKSAAKSDTKRVTADLSAMTLKKTEPKVKKGSKSKNLDPVKEYEKRLTEKGRMNLVIVGHVDAGKSTMMGHLLFLLGKVNQKTMRKYEKESEQMKKASFSFAWVLDATEDERSRGVTVDVAINEFETPKFHFTLLDAPGHKDFVPNMISGASQADVAILVVDARLGEFEKGLDHGGQTREHTILLRSLGISQLVVAVNKMDTVDWNKERFDSICVGLKKFLTQTGFKSDRILIVPTSGFTGDNLLSKHLWASSSLMEAIDAFEQPAREISGNFRLAVQDVFKDMGHVRVSGRIESGSVQVGEPILVLPIKEASLVKSILNGEAVSEIAFAGDRIDLELDIDIEKIQAGSIICREAVPMATIVEAQIVTFGAALAIGQPIIFHHLGSMEPAKITAIHDKSRVIKKNTCAKVEIAIERPIALEAFDTCKQFARFTLRYMSESVAAGIVQQIKQ